MISRNSLPPTIVRLAVVTTVLATTVLLAAAGDPGADCAVAKQRAVARKLKATMKCYELAAKNGVAVDTACLLAASGKMETTFLKADERGGCLLGPNTATVAGLLADGMDALLLKFPLSGGECATTQRQIAVKFFGSIIKSSTSALMTDTSVPFESVQEAADRAAHSVSILAGKGICPTDPTADHAIEVLAPSQALLLYETPASSCPVGCTGLIDTVVTNHAAGYDWTSGECVEPLGFSGIIPINTVLPVYRFELHYPVDFCGPPGCYPDLESVNVGGISSDSCTIHSHALIGLQEPITYRQWSSCARLARAAYLDMTGLTDACAPPP